MEQGSGSGDDYNSGDDGPPDDDEDAEDGDGTPIYCQRVIYRISLLAYFD